MGNSSIGIEEVRMYFKKVKSIRCLRSKITIDVTGFNSFYYIKEYNSYTNPSGMVVFWRDGVFADIVEYVPDKDCGCNKTEQ